MRALLVLCITLTIQLVLCKDEHKYSTDEPESLLPELLRERRDVQKLPTLNGQAAAGNQGPVFKLPKFPTTKAPVVTSAKPPAKSAPVNALQKPVKTPAVQAKPEARTVQAAAGKVPTPVVKLAGKLPTNAPAKPNAQVKPKPKPAKGHALRKPNKVKTATPSNAARKPNKGNKGKGQALRKRKNVKKLRKNKALRAQRQNNNKKQPKNQKTRNQAAGRKGKPNLAAKPGANQAAKPAAMNQAAQAATKKVN